MPPARIIGQKAGGREEGNREHAVTVEIQILVYTDGRTLFLNRSKASVLSGTGWPESHSEEMRTERHRLTQKKEAIP